MNNDTASGSLTPMRTFAIGTNDPYSRVRPLHYVEAATEDDAVVEACDRHGRATGVPTADVKAIRYGDMGNYPKWITP